MTLSQIIVKLIFQLLFNFSKTYTHRTCDLTVHCCRENRILLKLSKIEILAKYELAKVQLKYTLKVLLVRRVFGH